MFTSTCWWQRRVAIRYYVVFLEQNGCAYEKLTEIVCIFIFVDVNIKDENMPPSTRSIKMMFKHHDFNGHVPYLNVAGTAANCLIVLQIGIYL